MDKRLLARLQAMTVEEPTSTISDPVVVLGFRDGDTRLRGGQRTDVDRLNAAETVNVARKRAVWRPPLGNRAVSQQFAPPPPPPVDVAPSGGGMPIAIKMPAAGASQPPEVTLFWAGLRLLGERDDIDPVLAASAERELRGACAAAYYARATGAVTSMIEESLEDATQMCAALLEDRSAIAEAEDGPIHVAVEEAVRLLASGLPSAARLSIEGL